MSVNSYLAKATSDYSESKEYAPLNVYVKDADGRNYNVDVEDVANVVDVKNDTDYQVNISYKDNDTLGEVKAVSAVEVLEAMGYRVLMPMGDVCCGLTWHSTGQLDMTRKVLRQTLDVMAPLLEAGYR